MIPNDNAIDFNLTLILLQNISFVDGHSTFKDIYALYYK